DPVMAVQHEPCLRGVHVVESDPQRADDEVVLSTGEGLGPFPLHMRLARSGDRFDPHIVPDGQGEAEGVESRPEVRARCRYPHLRPIFRESHHRPSTRTTSPRFGATTSGETSRLPRAVAVSLSPLPVTVQVIVAPAGTSPASARWSSPATEAADAALTHATPSSA